MNHQDYLRRTFDLARQGLGTTWPNPLVGAVIVKNNQIIGEGFHSHYGGAHAEIEALNNCTQSPRGATLYVNLEPCCHTNKQTPPCAQRLVNEGISQVVISNLDPNPLVNGQGAELLRQNGIKVEHGILSEEGEDLNQVFFHAQRSHSPYVHLKMASTLDGKVALPTGESQWITGVEARLHVHSMRSLHQGIMVGAGTVREDDPKLNVRLEDFTGKQPYRIIFTESGDLPQASKIFHDDLREHTLIYTKTKLSFDFPASQVISINSLKEAMSDLFERKLIYLMLEGGPMLAASFLKEGLINRVSLFLNPSFLGAGAGLIGDFGLSTLSQRPKLSNIETRWYGDDLLLTGRII